MRNTKGSDSCELDEEEILQMVRREMLKLDDSRIYFECRRAHIRYIEKTLLTIKCVIALNNLGLPITTHTVSSVLKANTSSTVQRLHTLGDKNLIYLKRQSGRCYTWVVAPWFLEKVL